LVEIFEITFGLGGKFEKHSGIPCLLAYDFIVGETIEVGMNFFETSSSLHLQYVFSISFKGV